MNTKCIAVTTVLLAAAFAAQPSQALVLIDADTGTFASGALTDASPTEFGRLSRNNVPSIWSIHKEYPGQINSGTAYRYNLVDVTFASNGTQDVYYQISIFDPAGGVFASAYDGGYNPLNKAANYLGDAGVSSSSAVNPGVFQVVVAAGGSLTLHIGGTVSGTPDQSYQYLVEAFSDIGHGEDFGNMTPAPEPATWALMIIGFGLAGSALRRRRVASPL